MLNINLGLVGGWPQIRTGTRFHADEARWQVGNEFQKFDTWDFGAHKFRFARLIYAMHDENVFGKINSNGYDSHDFPSQVS